MARTYRITVPAQEFEVERENSENLRPESLPIKYQVLELAGKRLYCVTVEQRIHHHVHVGAGDRRDVWKLDQDQLATAVANAMADPVTIDYRVVDSQGYDDAAEYDPDVEI